RRPDDERVRAWLCFSHIHWERYVEHRPARELEAADEAVRLLERSGELHALPWARAEAGAVRLVVGAWEEAEEFLRGVLAEADRAGLRAVAPLIRSYLGRAVAMQGPGRLEESLALFREALREHEEHPNP